jgi:RimK family alpha-L-glutamate ligase
MLHSPERRRRSSRGRASVVLFAVARDWHVRALIAALERFGIEATPIRLEDCAFDSGAPFGLRCGALPSLPDGALVRTVAAGSFEAVTRRLGLLHALKALGVPVWNDPVAIERCVDKSMTTFLLGRAGLPAPQTWTVESIEEAQEIVREAPGPLVLKPLFGSQGRGLRLVRDPSELPSPEEMAGVYYLQRFVEGAGPDFEDLRVFVVAGEPVAAMTRRGATWITNVKQGGRPAAAELDRELSDLAAASAAAVGAAFCGVDILRGRDGAPYVLEVNSMPAWSGLQSVCDIDIAAILAKRFAMGLDARRGSEVRFERLSRA